MIFRFPRLEDEHTLGLAHQELEQDGSNFLLDGYHQGMPFAEYISRVENSAKGINLLEGRVASTFLVLEVDGNLVGRVSIRHELNEWLTSFGGHIGYAVRPAYRRQGYAKLLLSEGLRLCSEMGIQNALLTCSDSNLASAKVIESAGGVLENKIQDSNEILRRYWVRTK